MCLCGLLALVSRPELCSMCLWCLKVGHAFRLMHLLDAGGGYAVWRAVWDVEKEEAQVGT